MSDRIVHDAYARVRIRYSDEVWLALPPRAITDAIYQEMRQIDGERFSASPPHQSELDPSVQAPGEA